MKTIRQSISKELNKLNSYEQQAIYKLMKYFTDTHKAKYLLIPRDIDEAIIPLVREAEKISNSRVVTPSSFIPVGAAVIEMLAFMCQEEDIEKQ